MLVGDSFARHYYFLGRMLGKVTQLAGTVSNQAGDLLCVCVVADGFRGDLR